AEARSLVPFDQLEVVHNGQVVARAAASGTPSSARLELTLPAAPGWLAGRCRGTQLIADRPASQRVFAHTSPVYVRIQGKPPFREAPAVAALSKQLDLMREWVRHTARCTTEQQRSHLEQIFADAAALLKGG